MAVSVAKLLNCLIRVFLLFLDAQKHLNSYLTIIQRVEILFSVKSFEEQSTNSKFVMVQELIYWLLILAVIIIVIGLVQALQSRTCPRLDLSRVEVVLRLRSSRGRKCLGFIGSIYLVADVALNIIFDALIEALLKLFINIAHGILKCTGLCKQCQELG